MDVYPNPVSDKTLNLAFNGLEGPGDALIEVYNMVGMKIYSLSRYVAPGDIITVPIDNSFENGIYFVNANVNHTNLYQKFIVSK